VRPDFGGRKLASLQPLDLQELYTRLRERGLSARTVQIVHNILNRAFNQAVKWRVMAFIRPNLLIALSRNERRCRPSRQSKLPSSFKLLAMTATFSISHSLWIQAPGRLKFWRFSGKM
jgi:hypothetical protein